MKNSVVFITYELTAHTASKPVKGEHPSTIRRFLRLFVRFIVQISFAIVLCSCGDFLDGPFSKGKEMVPPLLYADNGTNLVTFWDEDLKTYRTYDQDLNGFLGDAVFYPDESDKDGSRNYLIAGQSIVPMTQLDAYGIQAQEEKGCPACHSN